MEFINLQKHIEYIDFLIQHECTGNPQEFAKKLRVSVRTLYYHLNQLRELGINITYDRNKQSYIYGDNGKLVFAFTKDELNNIRGGCSLENIDNYRHSYKIYISPSLQKNCITEL